MELDFAEVLLEVVGRRASDLHLTAGAPPMVRVRGRLTPMEGYPALTPTDTREIIYSILSNAQRQRLETHWQLDFAYQMPGAARFRVNCYFQRASLGAAFRLIPFELTPAGAARPATGRRVLRGQAARARARHRANRLGQVDDAGLADRRDQRDA
jgi:twitching motility protein PilT